MKPQRKQERPFDLLLNPDVRKRDEAIKNAIRPMDRVAREMDQKWGVDKLASYAPPHVAARYGEVLGELSEAMEQENIPAIVDAANKLIKGLDVMDRHATEAGHKPSPALAEYDMDGFKFMIVDDAADWPPIKTQRPEMRIYSLREVAIALQAQAGHPMIEKVKDLFPGSEISKLKGPVPDDDIPDF